MEPIDRVARRAPSAIRAAGIALGLALLAGRAAAQSAGDAGPPPPPARETGRMAAFVHEASRPATWAEPLGYTVYDQLRDEPEGWDSDTDGLARRLGSHTGRTAISLSVRHGTAALLDAPADPVRCASATGAARVAGAALEPFADLGCDGAVRPAVPRLAARAASAFAPLAWRQPGYTAGSAAKGIASGLVSAALLGAAKALVLGK